MEQDRLEPLEQAAWSGFMRCHAALYRELERRLLLGQDMALSTYEVLLRLAWAGKSGLRMSGLAQQVGMTSSGMTRLADRLQRDGLITRSVSETDQRAYDARITADGRRRLRRANRQHLADVRELFLADLTREDMQALAGIWERVDVPAD